MTVKELKHLLDKAADDARVVVAYCDDGEVEDICQVVLDFKTDNVEIQCEDC